MSVRSAIVEVLERRQLLATGALDTSFDGDGRVVHDGGSVSRFQDVAIQADGKILAVGKESPNLTATYAVFRYNVDGSLDTTYGGGDGIATVPQKPLSFQPFELSLQSDGKVVVAANLDNQTVGIARLTAAGAPDTTLGGTGYITPPVSHNARIAVQSDGKIVLAYGTVTPQWTSSEILLKRFNANGSADTTFRAVGAVFPASNGGNFVSDIAILSSGKILISGVDHGGDGYAARFRNDGTPDTTFGSQGIAAELFERGSASRIAALPDDSFYVAGAFEFGLTPSGQYAPLLARLTSSGTLDSTFGDGGVVSETSFNTPYYDVAIQPNGKPIVIAGRGDFYVARYLTNGTFDSTFGTGGRSFTDVDRYDDVTSVALAPDGKVVVAGSANDNTRNALIRLSSEYGTISGEIFNDANGDGVQNNGESTYTGYGISAYLDLDNNGAHTSGEPTHYTGNTGKFNFTVLPGTYTVRLKDVNLTNFVQSTPANNGGRSVFVVANRDSATKFGVTPLYTVSGHLFYDADGDAVRDVNESGYSGRVVYVDANDNGSRDSNEIATSSINTNGYYSLRLPAGTYKLRQVLPSGYTETGRSQVFGSSSSQFVPTGVLVVPDDVVSPASPSFDFGSVPTPGPVQSPFHGSPFAVGASPATLQAEDFDLGGQGIAYNDVNANNIGGKYRTAEGVDIKTISGTSNQYRISDAISGEWLEYTIDVATAGNYTVDFRVGNRDPNSKFRLELEAPGTFQNLTGAMTVPDTNSFDTFTTISKTVMLPAGRHVLRFVFDAPGSGGYGAAFDWMKITAVPQAAQGLVVSTGSITVPENSTTGFTVKLAAAPTANVVVNIARQSGDADLTSGVSTLTFTPANWNTPQSVFISAANDADSTNGSAAFAVSSSGLTTKFVSANENDDDTPPPPPPPPDGQQPYHGSPFAIGNAPVTIEAEDFDLGGQGIAYNDTTSSNLGNTYRRDEGVDIKKVYESMDRYRISDAKQGEWMEYTLNVATAGDYQLEFNVGNRDAGSTFHAELEIPGSRQNITGTMNVPDTNSFDTFVNVSKTVALPAGQQVLRFVFDKPGSSGYAAAIDSLRISPTDTTPPVFTNVKATAGSYVRDGSYANQNFGSSNDLLVKKSVNTGNSREVYLKFDLSAVTDVSVATLRLYSRLGDTQDANVRVNVFKSSNTSWSESGVTWNNKPAAGTTLLGAVDVGGTSAGFYEVDLSTFLRDEVAAGRKIVTLVLKANTASDSQVIIASDETANGPEIVFDG